MISVIKPLKIEVNKVTCTFHQNNPGKYYAGCTCSTKYSAREKTWNEMTEMERNEYATVYYGESI